MLKYGGKNEGALWALGMISKIAVKCKREGGERGAVRCTAKGRGGTGCALAWARSITRRICKWPVMAVALGRELGDLGVRVDGGSLFTIFPFALLKRVTCSKQF